MRVSSAERDEADVFLETCTAGSEAMHRALEELLARLEQPESQRSARRLLHQLTNRLKALRAAGEPTPFTVTELTLPGQRLTLIQLPSVFAPERWSFTFYEGLSRMPRSEFEGRVVAEVGSGSGWISLALVGFGQPHKVYGLDINPRAVLSARLNAHLNASRPDGGPIVDASGRSLLDRVEFHVSDALGWCRQRGIALDRIIGCIPQVLDPSLDATEQAATGSVSDEFLYALSNYCGRQGFIEDRFGLGLMARVLEESIELMTPGGKVVFNLGGRPGRARLRHLFERRGFRVTEIWQTRAPQAEDTAIGSLVEIEEKTDHRFEFFLTPHSSETVGARTAAAFAAKGGTIFHSINVYQGELPHAAHVKKIFAALRDPTFSEAHDAIDLALPDDRLVEEKLSFLADLSEWLARPRPFAYGETAGLVEFREHVARYLASYFQAPVAPESVVVTPNRPSALLSLLASRRPRQALVDRELMLPLSRGRSGASWDGVEVLEAPRSLELCYLLLEKLRPGLLAVALTEPESESMAALERLVDTAQHTATTLVLDVSAGFDLSSTPTHHPAFRLLEERPLPEHVVLLCGLVKGAVYRDLELGLLISENAHLLRELTDVAELTYSRAPLLAQRYYARILADLLSFRLPESCPPVRRPRPARNEHPGALRHRSLLASRLALPDRVVRLDYGENALPAPTCLRAHLLEAFVRRSLEPPQVDVRPELRVLLEHRFGIAAAAPERIHVAGGTAPFFHELARACAAQGGTLLLPEGVYGYFADSARLAGAEVRVLPTARENNFKLSLESLETALHESKNPWLYLNAPIVNPTGALYTPTELARLLGAAHAAQATVMIDTIFAGLESPEAAALVASRPLLPALECDAKLVLFGGISKELAAGGLRFGFAYATTPVHAHALERASAYGVPHASVRFAVKRTLARLVTGDRELEHELSAQRALLAERASRLCGVLEECGWEPVRPRGGLFVVARPTSYEDRHLELVTDQGRRRFHLRDDELVEALLTTTGLLINGPGWTGLPRYFRFVLSVEENTFDEALDCLRRFHRLVQQAASPSAGS